MIVDTSQEKLTGPVDREPERLDLQRIASGFITGYEAHKKETKPPEQPMVAGL
jgi:hypothetical protein